MSILHLLTTATPFSIGSAVIIVTSGEPIRIYYSVPRPAAIKYTVPAPIDLAYTVPSPFIITYDMNGE